jgi:uridine phosphorylase
VSRFVIPIHGRSTPSSDDVYRSQNQEAADKEKRNEAEKEKQIKNSNIKLDYTALGAAMISTNSDIPIKESAKVFSVSQKRVEKEIKNLENNKRPRSKKSKKFLEMIKN